MSQYLNISPSVAQAQAEGRGVVALESTIIAHGMPFPQNVETALLLESVIREEGAEPATVAISEGKLKAGLHADELEQIGKNGASFEKVSRRDLGHIVAGKKNGATTVATTMLIAHWAGIKIFATGGIGGVHRGASATFDISADLQELAQTPVGVVSAGAKSLLDLPKTLEYLETLGVPVVGYQTKEFPAFYLRSSGLALDVSMESPQAIAEALMAQQQMDLPMGMLIANPIPKVFEPEVASTEAAIVQAVQEAERRNISGKALTPFLLKMIKTLTGGESLKANIELVKNNAKLAAQIAQEYAGLSS